ncbi:MAG: hypothetical protein ACJ8J0_28460 [Longimicrobiaceae bacterium]
MHASVADALTSVLVARAAGELSGPELVDWAVDALSAGFDSPSLRVLAGLMPSEALLRDAEPLLLQATRELGIEDLDLEAMRRAYVPIVCRALLRGDLSPAEAAELIHRRVVSPLGHAADLMAWCYLWEGLGPDGEYLGEASNTGHIMAEARRWAGA